MKKKDTRPEAGYFARQNMAMRAQRAGDSGFDMLLNKDEYIGGNLKAQLAGTGIGVAAGAGVGAAVGKFTSIGNKVKSLGFKSKYGVPIAVGATVLGLTGQTVGAHSHTKSYLKEKGINYGILGVSSSTSAAKKKYLGKKWMGGGYDTDKKAEQILNKMGTVHKYHADTAGKSSEMKMYKDKDKMKMYKDKMKMYEDKYKMKMYENEDKMKIYKDKMKMYKDKMKMYEDTDKKSEYVMNKAEKTMKKIAVSREFQEKSSFSKFAGISSLLAKVITKAGPAVSRYGKNIVKDWKGLTRGAKGSILAQKKGVMTAGEKARALIIADRQMLRGAKGLAKRVGLPAVGVYAIS